MGIPKRIYQTWKSMDLPPKALGYQASWKWVAESRGFHYAYYTDAGCEAWVGEVCTKAEVEAYYDLPAGVERADFFRYLQAFYEGGVYGDIDTVCVASPEDWDGWETSEVIVGVEHGSVARDQVYQVCQWTFAAAPGSAFMRRVIDGVVENVAHPERFEGMSKMKATLLRTGPWLFTSCFWDSVKAKDTTMTLVEKVRFADHLGGSNALNPVAYVHHGFFGTWKPQAGSLDWVKAHMGEIVLWVLTVVGVVLGALGGWAAGVFWTSPGRARPEVAASGGRGGPMKRR